MNMTEDRIDLSTSQGWLDHLLYHLARYKFASRMIRPGDRVLDYGCGTGYGTRMMAEVAGEIWGVDSDESVIQKASSQYQSDNLTFFCDDVLFKSMMAGCNFNMITVMEVIEHVTRKDAAKMLMSLRGGLAENGILVLSTPKFKPIEQRSPFRAKHHVYEYEYEDLNKLLSDTFRRHLIFTQTDEIISMGNPSVCWTYIAICW